VLAFEVFAVVYALGGRNFPVLVGEAYTWQNENQNYGVAAAYAVLIMAISLLRTAVYLRVLAGPAGAAAMTTTVAERSASRASAPRAAAGPNLAWARRLMFWAGVLTLLAWVLVPIYLIALGAFGGGSPCSAGRSRSGRRGCPSSQCWPSCASRACGTPS
jgi:ABC-type Fe3+ transport system permease subunit